MERLILTGKVAPKSAQEVKDSRLGIGFEKLDRALFEPEKAYDKVAALGVKWVRIQSGWMRTEKQKGVYDFAWLDDIVDNLLKRGLRPWINIVYGNPLYTGFASSFFGAVGCPPVDSEAEKTAWHNYVKALTAHFKGKVEYFEMWNEPDIPYSWRHEETVVGTNGTPNGREYGLFAIETAKAIKEGNPDAKVIGFALGRPRYINFTAEAMKTGLGEYLDCASYHIYATDNTLRKKYYDTFASIIHSFNPNVEIIQGESGTQSRYGEAGALCRRHWSEDKQAKFLLRLLVTDLSLNNKFVSYFSAMDMVEALHGTMSDTKSFHDYGYFGVIGATFDENGIASGEYKEKPSYYALQTLASLFAEQFKVCNLPYSFLPEESKYVNGIDCDAHSMESHTFVLSDGRKALVYWNNTDILTSSYESTVSLEIMTEQIPKLIDLRDGSIYEIPESMAERQQSAVLLKHITIRDYPLMLIWD